MLEKCQGHKRRLRKCFTGKGSADPGQPNATADPQLHPVLEGTEGIKDSTGSIAQLEYRW